MTYKNYVISLYLAKQTLMLVSMRIFPDHATKQISIIPKAEIFIYLFTAMLCDVTITSLLCLPDFLSIVP